MKNKKTFYGNALLDAEDLKDKVNKYPIALEYYKISNKRKGLVNEEYEVYGVEIIKKEYIGEEIKTESNRIDNITKNEETLDKVIKLLKDNTVTPISLDDVINDMFIQ